MTCQRPSARHVEQGVEVETHHRCPGRGRHRHPDHRGGVHAGASQPPTHPAVLPLAATTASADRIAAAGLDSLSKGPNEQFHRRAVLQGGIPGKRSLYYVSYDRTYKNLPVIGGDAVVMTDASGNVLTTTAAPKGTLSTSTTPKVTAAQAEKTAEGRLAHVDRVVSNTLSVLAGKKSQLVYETIVEGHKATGVPSRLHVYVNAVTGSVVGIKDDARAEGNDNSQFYGPTNPIDTTNNSTVDSTRPGLQCDDYATGRPFTSSTNNFGTGSAYDKVTGCGDVMYIVQHEWSMLGSWLGRSGIDGNGGGKPGAGRPQPGQRVLDR